MTAIAYAKLAATFLMSRKVRKAGCWGALVFVHVLCENAARDATGAIPVEELELEHVAERINAPSLVEAETGIARAIKAGLIQITDRECVIVGWNDEWGKRPLSDAERKRLQRAREASKRDDVTNSHGGPVMDRDCHTGEERREIRGENPLTPFSKESTSQLKIPSEPPLSTAPKQSLSKRSRKPKESETPEEAVCIGTVLQKLADRTGRAYGGDKEHRRLVLRLLRDGYSVWDLRRVIAYCGDRLGWDSDPKMERYMSPPTLFGPDNFSKRIGDARLFIPEPDPDARDDHGNSGHE